MYEKNFDIPNNFMYILLKTRLVGYLHIGLSE